MFLCVYENGLEMQKFTFILMAFLWWTPLFFTVKRL